MKRITASVLATAMMASIAATPAAAKPAPIPLPNSPDYPLVQPGEIREAKLSPTPAVSVSVQQDEIARAGGQGAVLIPVMRDTKGKAIRNLRVHVNSPKGTRVTSVRAKGWTCTAKAVCTTRTKTLSPGTSPRPLYAVIAVKRPFTKPSAKITAKATWRGGKITSSESQTRLQVYRPFTVSLRHPTAGQRTVLTTHAGTVARQFNLTARIRNLGGGQADARWEQVSGPKTQFIQDTRVKNARDRLSQIVRIPNSTRGKQDYTFAMTVDANGLKIRKTITVRAYVQRKLGPVQANNSSFTDLAAQSRKPDKTRPAILKVSNGVRLRAKPGFTVKPGNGTTVRVVTGRKVASITWTVGTQTVGTGRSIRVKAPRTPHSSKVVQAQIRLRNGTGLLESALVRATSAPRTVSGDPTEADKKSFCTVADDAKKQTIQATTIKLGSIYTLSIPARSVTEDKDVRDAKKTCTGSGTLTYQKATLKRGNTELLSGVSGSITAADGVTMDKASWGVPDSLKPTTGTVGSVDLAAQDKPVEAKLNDGAWQLPDGTFAVAPISVGGVKVYGLAFVPLPDVGWAFDPDKTLLAFLNANEEDPDLKDGTLRFSQQASGPQDATAAFTVDTVTGNWQTAKVEVANIALGQTAGGDTISASGSGTLPLTTGAAAGVEFSVQCLHEKEASATCELAKNFLVKDFTLKWSRKGLGILGEAAVQYGDPATAYEFGVVGSYKSPKDWTLAVESAAAWDLGSTGLQLSKLAGSLGMKPISDTSDQSKLFIQLTGAISGFNVDSQISVKQITGAITNLCPQDVKDCDPGEVRVGLTADLAAKLPGKKDPVALHANSYINLTKMTFEFDFGFEDVQIGPDQLNVNKAQFILGNDDVENCKPQGAHAPAVADNVYSLQVIAQAKLFEATLTVGGTVQGNGYCLWGIPEAIEAGKAGETTSQVFGYTNYPNGADLKLPTGEDKILTPNTMKLYGKFNLPQAVDDAFGIAGDVDFAAEYALQTKGLKMTLTYTPTNEVAVYRSDTAKLTLKAISMTVSGSTVQKQFSLSLDADAELFMKGGTGTPDSVTPLYANAGFSFGEKTQAQFGLGVDTSKGSIQNAFGQTGLTVNTLAVAFIMTLPKPTANITFSGDVILPGSWVNSIGIQTGTREALAFSLGATNWCVAIEIGEENTAETKVAVDVANKGFLTAGYFKLIIAPSGCEVPIGKDQTRQIAPGFGFAFVGKIVGAPVIASLDANWKDGLVAKGKLQVPYLDMYAVRLGGSAPGTPAKVDFDIDSNADKYDVAFDVGLAIGAPERGIGAYVAVEGSLKTSDPDFVTFDFRGSGALSMGPIGVKVETLGLSGHIAKSYAKSKENTLAADATLVASVLGIGLRASGGLRYEHQQLVDFRIAIGASLNLGVGAVSGNIEFNYCLGVLTDLQADGSGSKCKPYDNYVGAAPAYRVGFFGSYRILWWSHGYTWTAFDQRGREGTAPPPAPTNEPQTVPGKIPPPVEKARVFIGTLENNADMTWEDHYSIVKWHIWFKTAQGQTVDGAPPCTTAILGSDWNAGDVNPPAENVNPSPGDGTCGLGVYVYNENTQPDVEEIAVKCSPFECTPVNGEYAGKALAFDGPNGKQRRQGRDALLSGLRSPLGVQPAGTRIDQDKTLMSPDTALQLQVRSWQVRLRNEAYERTPWQADAPAGTKIASMQFAKNGLLQILDVDGNVLLEVGKKAPLDPDTNPVYLHITSDVMSVKQVSGGQVKEVWNIGGYGGSCFPDADTCQARKP